MKLESVVRYLSVLVTPRCWAQGYRIVKSFVDDRLLPYKDLRIPGSSTIHPSVNFYSEGNIEIGEEVIMQANGCLWASPNAKIIIGNIVGIGPGTMIFSSNHGYKLGSSFRDQPWVEKDVIIGSNVWIGSGVIIVAGVTIGSGSVIAAGSVVTKDIPADVVAAGSPCRVIKQLENE